MKLKPFKTLIVIKLDEYPIAGWADDGKPVVPQIWHKHKPYGTVEVVGEDCELVKVGDRVVVNPYAIIEMPGEKSMLIKEGDILALIEEEDNAEQEAKK
jgi:co-chaperonin GroES (HSP10)